MQIPPYFAPPVVLAHETPSPTPECIAPAVGTAQARPADGIAPAIPCARLRGTTPGSYAEAAAALKWLYDNPRERTPQQIVDLITVHGAVEIFRRAEPSNWELIYALQDGSRLQIKWEAQNTSFSLTKPGIERKNWIVGTQSATIPTAGATKPPSSPNETKANETRPPTKEGSGSIVIDRIVVTPLTPGSTAALSERTGAAMRVVDELGIESGRVHTVPGIAGIFEGRDFDIYYWRPQTSPVYEQALRDLDSLVETNPFNATMLTPPELFEHGSAVLLGDAASIEKIVTHLKQTISAEHSVGVTHSTLDAGQSGRSKLRWLIVTLSGQAPMSPGNP